MVNGGSSIGKAGLRAACFTSSSGLISVATSPPVPGGMASTPCLMAGSFAATSSA